MIKQITYIICITFCCLTSILNAQNDSILIIDTHDNQCFYCKDGSTHQHENPYQMSFKKEIPFIATGLGLFGTGFIIKSNNGKPNFTTNELDALDANNVNQFDRGAIYNNSNTAQTASDILLYSGVALPTLFFLTNHHTRKDVGSLFIMSLEVFTITNGLTFNTKYIFNRTRPMAYNPTFSYDERMASLTRLSFISGHTAQTAAFSFFIAKVINDYHPNMKKGFKIGTWAFALALPSVTGYLRVKSGKHYNTDVLTGFAVGAAVGWLVPQLHKSKKLDSKFSVAPYNYNGTNGLTFNWKLN
jgi:membrane-associated phospholipid phosphatase